MQSTHRHQRGLILTKSENTQLCLIIDRRCRWSIRKFQSMLNQAEMMDSLLQCRRRGDQVLTVHHSQRRQQAMTTSHHQGRSPLTRTTSTAHQSQRKTGCHSMRPTTHQAQTEWTGSPGPRWRRCPPTAWSNSCKIHWKSHHLARILRMLPMIEMSPLWPQLVETLLMSPVSCCSSIARMLKGSLYLRKRWIAIPTVKRHQWSWMAKDTAPHTWRPQCTNRVASQSNSWMDVIVSPNSFSHQP